MGLLMNINEWTMKECGVQYDRVDNCWFVIGDIGGDGEWDYKNPACMSVIRKYFGISNSDHEQDLRDIEKIYEANPNANLAES